MKRIVPMVLLFLLSAALAAQDKVWIEGRVFDRETKDPLPAYVQAAGGPGVSADADGRFKLGVARPAAGLVEITVWLIGYRKKTVAARPGIIFEVALEIEPLAAREITVTADSVVSETGNPKTVSLAKMDVYRVPGAAADPLYASQVLPGVNSPPDASSLLIRGGAPDEVAYFFDGIEILHPFLSESLHESYFSVFDNQVIEKFSVATSGFHPKFGDALSGVIDLSAKDSPARGEGGLGLSVVGLNSYAGFPLGGFGSFVGSYDRGTSELLTELNSRDSSSRFQTEHAFAKLNFQLAKSHVLRLYGLSNTYRFSQSGVGEFGIRSKNLVGAASWTAAWSKSFVTRALVSILGYDMTFDQTDIVRVRYGDSAAQARFEAFWDLGRHFLEFGADVQERDFHSEILFPEAGTDSVGGRRLGVFVNDKFRISDRLYVNAGARFSSLDLLDSGGAVDPRFSAAYVLTKRDTLRFSAGTAHQFGDYFILTKNPSLIPKSAVLYSLSYDRITETLEFRAAAYDKEYRRLYLQEGDGAYSNGGSGFARGIEGFVKIKNRRFDVIAVYNYLHSRRKENDVPILAPSPYEIAHSATGILTWKFKNASLGLRYSFATGRPFTPLLGREWAPESLSYIPEWGAPYSERLPAYQRMDLNGSWSFLFLKRMIVLYFGITNLLDNENISRYDYGDDYAGRRDQPSIFGRSLFAGIYVPFF